MAMSKTFSLLPGTGDPGAVSRVDLSRCRDSGILGVRCDSTALLRGTVVPRRWCNALPARHVRAAKTRRHSCAALQGSSRGEAGRNCERTFFYGSHPKRGNKRMRPGRDGVSAVRRPWS